MMTHRRKYHRGGIKDDIKILCPSQMEPALLSQIEEGRKELQKNPNGMKGYDPNEPNVTSAKNYDKYNTMVKNNIETIEK